MLLYNKTIGQNFRVHSVLPCKIVLVDMKAAHTLMKAAHALTKSGENRRTMLIIIVQQVTRQCRIYKIPFSYRLNAKRATSYRLTRYPRYGTFNPAAGHQKPIPPAACGKHKSAVFLNVSVFLKCKYQNIQAHGLSAEYILPGAEIPPHPSFLLYYGR